MMTEDKTALLMRLKSLELQGYKTFASQTVFEFAGLITAIVGPNGSGKSNVADSLRWVLGEQSYSLLRGKKTADMIFSGSESRPRAGMASVTVVFDNSDGWLPIDFSEVSITRRAYRDGQNEYLVNGQRVRLKNVNELLGQSGLAERTYTIIGQGVVDAALSLKAEERRRLFEEAAGIGLYRARREEAQRRLETTRRNLERVQDILAELSPRLRSLERQAKRAREFEQIRADLQVMLREWYGYHWHLAQGELREARDLARQRESKLEQARKSYQELDEQIASKRAQLQGVRARLNDWHRQIALLHTRREELSTQTAVVEERLRSWLEQRQNAQVELVRLQEELGLDRERFLAAEKDVERLNTELSEARAQAEEAFSMLQKHQKERANAEGVVLASRQALAALNRSQGELQARLTERRALAERQSGELSEAETALEAANNEISLAQKRASESQTAYSRTEFDRAEAEKALQDQRQRRTNAEASLKALQEEGAVLSAELARLKAQMDVIEQAETALSGYARGAQALIKSVRQGRLKGAKGALNT
ncbi:MAG TPA: AAA family ATPase, partial [Anaerolineales bacterium]